VILIVGLAMVVFNVLAGLGGDAGLAAGLNALVDGVPADHLVLVPTDRLGDLFDWINLLVIGSLGNLAGADLMQRVFSSKSEKVAQQACLFAGAAYIVVGVAPARLAAQVLSPTLVVLFVLALLSAVLSTLDSAILTAASVFAHNVLGPHMKPGTAMMKVTQACVVATTLVSVAFAFAGESAFSLLEGSYALTLAGPFVVLVFGLFWRRGDERAAVASLVLGYAITLAEMIWPDIDLGVPVPLVALAISAVVYVALALARPAPTA
jgi:SSS family solute:Na+ symporter